MPRAAKKLCLQPRCPNLVERGQTYCKEHEHLGRQHAREIDRRRGPATERGYDARWQKARRYFLGRHPLCAECEKEGRTTPATVVDHIQPHQGNYELFWDQNNWQPLCQSCHSKKTAKEDGAFGNPIKGMR